jgi:hypothetical protein
MLTDRRPILLANARVVHPSRDFDGPGDVLIADGTIRDSKRGIGAAGVPEGTDIINCAGKIVAPGLIDMRAFVGEPGASHRETFASASEYFHYYGLDQKKLAYARPDALVMHPGPMNRGVEIDSAVADGAQSLIREQVEMGVAVRMAVLEALARNLPNA